MKYYFLTLVFFGAFTLSNCSIEEDNINKKVSNHLIMDSHTLSNYKDLPIIHAHLDLEVDFVNKLLRGSRRMLKIYPSRSWFYSNIKSTSTETISWSLICYGVGCFRRS